VASPENNKIFKDLDKSEIKIEELPHLKSQKTN
jgi:hypothetical protein